MWINTWMTILLVMGWVVIGLTITSAEGGWWVTGGAVALAVAVPPITYRFAKLAQLWLLERVDPSGGDR